MSATLPRLTTQVPQVAAMLRLMSNPDRLAILCHLAGGEASVRAIQGALGLRQPGLSQQLSELREAGLVTVRRESRTAHYALADARTRLLLSALDEILAGAAQDTPPAGALPVRSVDAPARRDDQSAHFARLE